MHLDEIVLDDKHPEATWLHLDILLILMGFFLLFFGLWRSLFKTARCSRLPERRENETNYKIKNAVGLIISKLHISYKKKNTDVDLEMAETPGIFVPELSTIVTINEDDLDSISSLDSDDLNHTPRQVSPLLLLVPSRSKRIKKPTKKRECCRAISSTIYNKPTAVAL
uniref:Transmembrane protein n=1 Tax=Rhabditophanes sp. KR3021 TaxID=114890 RepID=A0AC35UEP6_9BILA